MGKAIATKAQPERLAATACWKQACAEVIVTAPESAGKAVVIMAAFNRDGVAIVNRLSSGGCFPQVGWNRGVVCFIPVYG